MERGEQQGLGWVFGGVGIYIAALGIAADIESYAKLPPAPRPIVVQTPGPKRCEMKVSGDGIWIEFHGKWTEREELVAIQAFRERVNADHRYEGSSSTPWE